MWTQNTNHEAEKLLRPSACRMLSVINCNNPSYLGMNTPEAARPTPVKLQLMASPLSLQWCSTSAAACEDDDSGDDDAGRPRPPSPASLVTMPGLTASAPPLRRIILPHLLGSSAENADTYRTDVMWLAVRETMGKVNHMCVFYVVVWVV